MSTMLSSNPGFDYLAAEKSSVMSFADYTIQFFWHQNLLEECESFSFKWSGKTDEMVATLNKLIDQRLTDSPSVADLFERLIVSEEVPTALTFAAKAAYDEYFNFELNSFESDLICRCFGVTREALLNDLQKGETVNLEGWKSKYMVAMGCGTCEAAAANLFQGQLDMPTTESEALAQLRRRKVTENNIMIRPKGMTPIAFREFLMENLPLEGPEIDSISGYQVFFKGLNPDQQKLIEEHFRLQHQLKLEVTSL